MSAAKLAPRMLAVALALLLAALMGAASAAPSAPAAPAAPSVAELLERLSGAPDEAISDRVAEIERAADAATAASDVAGEVAGDPMLPDAMFTAARACEERLRDPVRALVLYERILERFPDARVAMASQRRAHHLREQVGARGGSSEEARELARLMADGERLPLAEALRRADELAGRPWPGAAEVLLWSAELVRRRGALDEAIARYRAVLARYRGSAAAVRALRGLAGAAVERGDWALAEEMALALPIVEPADALTRDELLAKAKRGRTAGRWAAIAQATLIAGSVALLLSLLQLGGWRVGAARALWPPPIEVAYMAPVAALITGASFTGNVSITPAVAIICGGGLALAWLSGATLTEARRRQRESKARSLGHLVTCAAAVLALAYLAIISTGLLDLLISTVQLGPER